MDPTEVRNQSLKATKRLRIEVLATLPLLDDGVEVRDDDEVTSRLLAMHAIAATAYGLNRQKAITWLAQEGLAAMLTEGEQRFLREGVGDPKPFQHQVEGMWALAWAMGIVNDLDFSKYCDDGFVFLLPDLKGVESSNSFRQKFKPRLHSEVFAKCDLAYCLHWAVRDARLRGAHPPNKIKWDALPERRRALDWLLSKERWDDISLDT